MLTVLFSLTVYGSTALILFALGYMASSRQSYIAQWGGQPNFWTIEIFLSLLIFSLVAAVRWNVGADHLSYLEEYGHAAAHGFTVRDFELIFSFITKFMAYLGLHFSLYFGVLAFIQISFIYGSFRNERNLLPYIGVMIMMGTHYIALMNGIRQMIAVTIFLFATTYIYRGKFIPFICLIILASLFHQSALICLPLYLIRWVRSYVIPWYAAFLLAMISLYIGRDPNWIVFIEGYIKLISDLLGYSDRYVDINAILDASVDKNIGPRFIAGILSILLLSVFARSIGDAVPDSPFRIYYNFAVVGMILSNLTVNAHNILVRPIEYLRIFSIPALSYLLWFLWREGAERRLVFVLVLLLACAYTPLSVIADHINLQPYEDFSNYKVFWMENK